MTDENDKLTKPARLRWARLRFSIVAPLLASPPESGTLAACISELAARSWEHPGTKERLRFCAKTIERWFYIARAADDPIVALERKVPKHAGTHPSISGKADAAIRDLRRDHPTWTAQLLHDNLRSLARVQPELGKIPSYPTVRRYMRHHGLSKRRKSRRHEQDPTFVPRERRLFEVRHVHGLWHCDFHQGKRKVVTASGDIRKVVLFAVLDDRSRVCCHAQWYLDDEDTESFVHGLSQAFQKRGLPRALLSDNGAAMRAAETREGLERLSIAHHTILPQAPEQNAKQEVFWNPVEGRLMSMLEGVWPLSLALLNQTTQAWVELDYHHALHSELKQTPLERWRDGPTVGRPSPSSDELRRAFRMAVSRKQRLSDGTITVAGVRYELPSVYRTLLRPTVRVARWDLSCVELVDCRRGTHLATLLPVDKERNAERQRRAIDEPSPTSPEPRRVGMAPLMRELLAEHAATGLPPPYVPLDPTALLDIDDDDDHRNNEDNEP